MSDLQTLGFFAGGFQLGAEEGLNRVQVTEPDPQSGDPYVIATRKTIEEGYLVGDQTDQNIQFVAIGKSGKTLLEEIQVDLGAGNDTLIVGQASPDPGQSVKANHGSSAPVAEELQVAMGEGDDLLIFGGAIKESVVSLGAGADEVVFTGNIKDVVLDLGPNDETLFQGRLTRAKLDLAAGDGERDVIRIADGSKIQGLKIVGADQSDVLYIGSSEYNYDAASSRWVNVDDPGDIRSF